MIAGGGAEAVLRQVIENFAAGRVEDAGSLLAEDVTAYVTNAAGGVDQVHGRTEYVTRLNALQAPELSVGITQSLAISSHEALAMVEIRAEREGKSLHNFAAFLARLRAGQVAELWMVEALPAYSDEFWR